MEGPQVSISATKVFEWGSFFITNSVLASYVVTFLIILFALYVRRNTSLVPTRIQLVFEMLTEFFTNMLKSAFGSEKRARKALPLFFTIFLFLFLANQFSILPFVGSVVAPNGPAFRTPTSDWNQTMALALVVLVGTHIIAFSMSPIKHLGNYIKIASLLKSRSIGDVGSALLEMFLGVLDIIGEFSKIISLSARLFGNILAGEVIIIVISGIASFTAYFIPIPFIILSAFSSLIQVFVFVFLSIFFMAGTINAVSPAVTEKQLT